MSGQTQLFRFGSGSHLIQGAIDGILFGIDTDGIFKFVLVKEHLTFF